MARVFEVVETTVKRWRVVLSDEYVERCIEWCSEDQVATCAVDLVDNPCPDDTIVELVATETTCRSAELTEEDEHAADAQAD